MDEFRFNLILIKKQKLLKSIYILFRIRNNKVCCVLSSIHLIPTENVVWIFPFVVSHNFERCLRYRPRKERDTKSSVHKTFIPASKSFQKRFSAIPFFNLYPI